MTATPFFGSDQPGLRRDDVLASVTSTSPAALTFQLPRMGVFEFVLSVWGASNNVHRTIATGHIIWYAYNNDATRILCKTGTLASQFVGNMTAITVSDPSTAGVVTATVTFSVGSSQEKGLLQLRELSSIDEQATF